MSIPDKCLICSDDFLFFFITGNSPDEPKQRGEASKPERYETTVPLLLKGNERRPLWQLAVNTHKAHLAALAHC